MLTIQAFSILAALATSTLVSAHGHVAKWTVNGAEKAGFNPSNPPMYGPTAERPTVNSDQGFVSLGASASLMACGGTAAPAGLETWDVDAGSTVTAHWNTWPDSHKGPASAYMAKCPGTTCDGVDAGTLDWFKVAAAGYENGDFATTAIVKTGIYSFKIPSDIASGPYLVRHDLIAMHGPRDPQIYPVCFQANLIGTGSAVPKDTGKFPAIYDINPIFQTIDIYNGDLSTLVAPGPPAYVAGGASGPVPAPAPAPAPASSSAAAASSVAAPIRSSVAPVASSSAAAATSSAAPVAISSAAAPAPVESEYPVEPIPSSAAPAIPSSAAPIASSSAAPAAPSSAAPVLPSSAAPAVPSSAAAPPAASSAAPAPVTPPAGGSLGGPAPAITKQGDKFIVNGGSYNFESDAKYASCMSQMNKCKNWANALPNSEVGAAFTLCDAQASTCFSGSKKRDVINRYARRALPAF